MESFDRWLSLACYTSLAPLEIAQSVAQLLGGERWQPPLSYLRPLEMGGRYRPTKRLSKDGKTLALQGALEDANVSSVSAYTKGRNGQYESYALVSTGRLHLGDELPFECRVLVKACAEAHGRSQQVSMLRDLVWLVRGQHAVLGVWPDYEMAIQDVTLVQTVLDTRWGSYRVGLPVDLAEQAKLTLRERKFVGGRFLRHPRWGTFLREMHLEQIGGLEHLREVVTPAEVSSRDGTVYIQLTASCDTALTVEVEEQRMRLEELMRPILVRAT